MGPHARRRGGGEAGTAVSVWDEVVGQRAAIEQFTRALAPGGNLAQAWLIAGPPGSGRSIAARAFAAALQCEQANGCGQCHACRMVLAGSHADVAVVATDTLSISKDEVRSLVATAQRSPATAPYRIIIVEDADRMSAGTFNVLLKAIEEPPPRTIWMLCVPSAQDMAQTIRSRCRLVTLVTPAPADVADLLARRDGADPQTASRAARAAQGHIGIARRYVHQPEALAQREEAARALLALTSVGGAVAYAQKLVEAANAEAKDEADRVAQSQQEEFLRATGQEAAGRIPPQLRSQLKQLEDEAKKRATRMTRDVIDRFLLDIHSVFRDMLTLQLNAGAEIINEGVMDALQARAEYSTPASSLAMLDAVGTARERIGGNVPPQLALEALLAQAALG
nr:DNA polymerase III subunit delta' [Helcobacillus massiliensis]